MDHRIDELLELADRAVDRDDWAAVARHAAAVIEMDPGNVEGASLLVLARRRTRTAPGASSTPEGERRTLTVMFCDLVGSTEMADRHDPEVTRWVLQDYHRLVSTTIEQHGGFVAHYMGDGALAYFGWPTAVEDSALLAVRAALGLLEAVASWRSSVMQRLGSSVDMRVGVHTGLVVVGEMGAGSRRERDDVVGETPNIAARLEAFAAPGTVVISENTYNLAARDIEATDLGPQQLKGISRPIRVWRVDGLVGRPTRFDSRQARSPFVGRGHDLEVLRQQLDITRAGTGTMVGICGEAGVGKSRLVERFLTSASAEGRLTILRSQCSPLLVGTAFHPITATVLASLEVSRAASHSLSSLTSNSAMSADSREQMLDRVTDSLLEVAASAPAVLVLEDIHWADASTLEVLRRTASRIAGHQLLLIVTYRPDHDMAGLAGVTEITLPPLDRSAFDELVHALTPDREVSPEAVEQLFDRSGGVPLFVEELVSSLLERPETGSQLEGVAAIPLALNDVLVARFDRCGPAKQTAQVAAVLGRTIRIDVLERVAERADLSADLDRLTRAGVLHRVGTEQVRFKHALVQDAAYSTLLHSTARILHQRAADALLTMRPAEAADAPEIVARHLDLAGNHRLAVAQWMRAAEQSARRFAPNETMGHLHMALAGIEHLDDSDERTAIELQTLLLLGPAVIAGRGYGSEEVQQVYERAAELCTQAPDSPEAFAATRGLAAYFLVSEHLERAEDLAGRALAQATRTGDDDELLEAEAWLGTTQLFRGHLDGADALLARAAARYDVERHGWHGTRYGIDPAILSLSHLSWLRWLRADPAGARRRRDEVVELAARLNAPMAEAHAYNYASGLALFLGDDEEALHYARLEHEVASEFGFPHYVAYAAILGAAAIRRVDAEAAEAQLREGLALRHDTGARLAVAFHHGLLAEIHLLRDDLDSAEAAAAHGIELARSLKETWWLPELERVAGEVARHRGAFDSADATFERSLAHAEQMGAHLLAARTRMSIAGLRLAEGRTSDAASALAPLAATTLLGLPEDDELRTIQGLVAEQHRAQPLSSPPRAGGA